MNKVILMGRTTKDPDVRYNNENKASARYTLAVDRRTKEQQSADFISCISFGKTAEFIEKHVKKGVKLVVEGRIQTGSYTNKDGNKVYTTDVVVDSAEFAESKSKNEELTPEPENEGFMQIPDTLDDELPFA